MKNLRAKILDRKGIKHELKGLVCDQGETIKFRKGSLNYILSLSSIKRMEVGNVSFYINEVKSVELIQGEER